jgi:hypothetical protein
MKASECVVCGEGKYGDMNIHSSTDLHNAGLGMKLVGRTAWRAVECDSCGNVQVFRLQRRDDQLNSGRW